MVWLLTSIEGLVIDNVGGGVELVLNKIDVALCIYIVMFVYVL